MIVYPDLAFCLGMALHGAAFRLAILLLDLRRPRWLFLLSLIGSGVSSAMLMIPEIPPVISAVLGICLPVFLFRGKSFRGTIFNYLTVFGVLILYLGLFLIVSGIIFGISLAFLGSGGYFLLSFFQSLFSAFFAFRLGLIFLRMRKKKNTSTCCDCLFLMEGKTVEFRAYVDTGNFLTDPVSGLPVVILEFSLLRKVFDRNFPPPMSYEFFARFDSRAKVIPYRSVSGDGQMLSAFVPELFSVNGIQRKVVIAVSDRRLENRGRFSGIIGPDLIGGE